MLNIRNNRKSQVWTIEFIISFVIFTAAIILSVKSIYNIYANDNFKDITAESEFVSQSLLSEGFPLNWDKDTVIRIGLVTDKKINESKLRSLYDLEYSSARELFGIRSNFFIYFSNASGIIPLFYYVNENISQADGCGYGHSDVVKQFITECSININSVTRNDMIKIDRIVNYNGSILMMNVYIWR